jgi:hypothetical protein
MITIEEVIESIEEGRLKEVFTSGTAVTIGSIESFTYDNVVYNIPYDPKLGSGPFTFELYNNLTDI